MTTVNLDNLIEAIPLQISQEDNQEELSAVELKTKEVVTEVFENEEVEITELPANIVVEKKEAVDSDVSTVVENALEDVTAV
jgi:hypothetical protein